MMKHFYLFALLLVCPLAPAIASAPSEQSINQLLNAMNTEGTIDQMLMAMGQAIKAGMEQGLRGKKLSPEQQAEVAKFEHKQMAIMRDELSFDKLKDIYIKVYQQTLTQEEVDGLITFYSSSSGHALIQKVPKIMQSVMAAMQPRLAPMQQRFNQALQEFIAGLEAAGNKTQPTHS